MENLPPDLTDQGLRKQLVPFMKALYVNDWYCQKPRKKPFGTVVFLLSPDGQRFLQQHGEQTLPSKGLTKPRSKARLTIMGKYVYCNLSKNRADPFALKCLAKLAEDRRIASEYVYAHRMG